jgi:hypothetical protein
MNRAHTILLVLLVASLATGCVDAVGRAADKGGASSLQGVAEDIRKGKIDVGKTYGQAPDARFHRIHTGVLGLECATCHVDKVDASVAVFTASPPVDISRDSPGPIDRRNCLGCHRAGPGRAVYGTGSP